MSREATLEALLREAADDPHSALTRDLLERIRAALAPEPAAPRVEPRRPQVGDTVEVQSVEGGLWEAAEVDWVDPDWGQAGLFMAGDGDYSVAACSGWRWPSPAAPRVVAAPARCSCWHLQEEHRGLGSVCANHLRCLCLGWSPLTYATPPLPPAVAAPAAPRRCATDDCAEHARGPQMYCPTHALEAYAREAISIGALAEMLGCSIEDAQERAAANARDRAPAAPPLPLDALHSFTADPSGSCVYCGESAHLCNMRNERRALQAALTAARAELEGMRAERDALAARLDGAVKALKEAARNMEARAEYLRQTYNVDGDVTIIENARRAASVLVEDAACARAAMASARATGDAAKERSE